MDASWPAIVSIEAAFVAFSVSALIGIFFGLYPANKAAWSYTDRGTASRIVIGFRKPSAINLQLKDIRDD